MDAISVLDHGVVDLIKCMGDDLAIVQSAQSSFNNYSTEYGEREQKILRSLMREKHGVPFEHVALTYRLKMPIFVARQLVKHRMSSWSEHSARYSKMEVEYYLPIAGNVRTQEGKPMQYRFSTAESEAAWQFLDRLDSWCQGGMTHYQWAIDNGIAREQARMFIPINAYTTITWTLNVRSLLNVLALRNDSHAQGETRAYAVAMEQLAGSVIPDTLEAFNEFGRVVP
jgi:thymidylate synthase (FAD)